MSSLWPNLCYFVQHYNYSSKTVDFVAGSEYSNFAGQSGRNCHCKQVSKHRSVAGIIECAVSESDKIIV